ncbi:MAG: MATE family efflux transporter [Lachnospiraceae bacterium]|nr:MATE family efflux transporter [Lachnospiraceae bacterium]
MQGSEIFAKERISKILLRLAPPVMFAQLIQALYNIIDSLFVGRYSETGLTALSIIYPVQLLMIALAVGTGVGINTLMAARMGAGRQQEAEEAAGTGTPLALIIWAFFAVFGFFFMPAYARMSTQSEAVIREVILYGRTVCVFSFGLTLESVWTKVLQAEGDMKTPMIAQIAGAAVNIALDPILIFGLLGFPEMGILGAAAATVAGQITAACIVARKGFRRTPARREALRQFGRIYRLGIPNILMQSAYTFYILGLNLILASFSDQAVTALGLYYKWQTFFFIPLGAMQTCIVPVISYNYAARNIGRCRAMLKASVLFGWVLMAVGTLCFVTIPEPMLRVFTRDELVVAIGRIGFRYIGPSFLPMVTSLIFPVFFQAVGMSLKSSALTVLRTVVLFVPLGFLFSRFGLDRFWLTFPVTETLTSLAGLLFYRQFLDHDYVGQAPPPAAAETPGPVLLPSRPGVVITIAREHGSGGKQIGKLTAERLGIPFYYKEMIALAAHESGLDQEFISRIHQNAPDAMRDLYLSSHVVQLAVRAQERIIRRIAENGSCVIVGRAADHVLRDFPDVVRVFIHAPEEYRIRRIMEVYGDSHEEARRSSRRSDKARASYYRHISGQKWRDPRHYDLILDSSCGPEETAAALVRYIEQHGAAAPADRDP